MLYGPGFKTPKNVSRITLKREWKTTRNLWIFFLMGKPLNTEWINLSKWQGNIYIYIYVQQRNKNQRETRNSKIKSNIFLGSNYFCCRSLLNKKHTSNHWMKEVIRGWGVMRRRNICIQPRRKKNPRTPWIYDRKYLNI